MICPTRGDYSGLSCKGDSSGLWAVHSQLPESNSLKWPVEDLPISELNLCRMTIPPAVDGCEWPSTLH